MKTTLLSWEIGLGIKPFPKKILIQAWKKPPAPVGRPRDKSISEYRERAVRRMIKILINKHKFSVTEMHRILLKRGFLKTRKPGKMLARSTFHKIQASVREEIIQAGNSAVAKNKMDLALNLKNAGYPLPEIATMMGVSIGTIKSHICRAQQRHG